MSTALLVTKLVPLPQSGGLGALWQEAKFTVLSTWTILVRLVRLALSCLPAWASATPPPFFLEAVRPLPVFFPTLAHRLQLPSPAGFLYP